MPYDINGETKSFYPDFLIVRSDPNVDYIVDILDPHGDPDGKTGFLRLDLTDISVRDKVSRAMSNDELDHIFDMDGIIE